MREHQRSRSKEPAGSDWGFGRLHGPPPPLLTTTQILSKVQLASILPLKSPTSFHTSSQKSNQLTHFLLIVQPASILPLKIQPHLPYFLSNVQPASILSLKNQTTFHTSSQSPNTPSILPLKSPSTFHTAFQKFNHLPYLLSKDQPALFGTSAVIFFTKMAVVEKSIRRCRIDCLAEG